MESVELQRQAIRARASELFKVQLKSLQTDAIHRLVYRQTDLILIAKTGFGKSIIFQAVPLLWSEPAVCLILMPLNALQSQQLRKLESILTARPFVLIAESNNPENLRRIREGEYTHGKISLPSIHAKV